MSVESNNDFKLTYNIKDDCLYVFVSGPEDNLRVSKKFWSQIHAKAVKTGVTKILVEEDFPNQVSVMEMFETGEFIAQIFDLTTKIAHVDKSLSDIDLNKFAEDVAVSRGLLGQIFNNREDAVEWLHKKPAILGGSDHSD